MKYSDKTISEIADLIDCGFICFLEKANENIEHYPKEEDLFDDEEGPWQDVINKIEENPDDYIEIEQMDSKQSFRVMENFTEEVKSVSLQGKLANALSRPKPFQNFKYLIDDSDYRQDWFDFKLSQNILWVKKQISIYENE